ncbi:MULTISPECIES: branched-chain amino acid ABC transporter substrate-binding protein [Massilia]|uniref:ABC transporter substrate-binding protein n=2 Tax=Massilia TaxID=149698 RepID=A0A7X3FZP3_9BURK|nr:MULTISPECIES: branched-chain amino acid ABC transporter substrate-binding protein [Telluria group]KQY05812.1 branched-chain amino acid ABC transporter substrate-binding protein [Massilia sp. Root133]KQZ52263.1 branched-chain amino acid ABC transporter substrate-binding protein [Massilia sp. Root1485]MDN4042158.1 branched-chain amino acid ABC transporter substrate-binding protein [Massilia sp. YIM B02787]MVW61001.1 ABC transporter substrate-binding protein [Telluria cellulosilytica]
MQVTTKLIPLAIALAFAGTASAQQVVKIGHVAPISGPSAHLGKDNENAARMAIDELNAKGVTLNGQKVTLQLISEDDGADPKQGTAVAQKLVDAKVNGVIGHLNSGTTVPASKIYNDAGIVQISPATTAPVYTRQHFPGAFRVVASDAKLGSTLSKYAIDTLHAKNIAIIDDRTTYGQGVADEFAKGLKKPGIKVVGREFTSATATDYTAILTSIKAKKPDLIFFGGMDSVAGPMLKQMKALGITAVFMGGDGMCTDALGRLAGDGLGEGRVYCAEAGGVKGPQEKVMEDFRARYKKKFNMDVQLYAPYVYDSVMVMATAMQNAKSADPAKYLPVLKNIKYEGVTGTIQFDANGDIKDGALTLFTYKGGKRTKLDVIR